MKKCIIFFLFIYSAFAVAIERIELKDDYQTIYVDKINNWTMARNLFGIPFTFFSPKLHGQRSNISFTDTGVKLGLDKTSISDVKEYKRMKEKWSEQTDSVIITFLSFESYLNQFKHQIYKIGFIFQNEGKNYVETSYYIQCRKQIIFSKSLRLEANKEHEVYFNQLIQSLNCSEN
ncbi:MAG: hypothetical protein AB7I27_09485 [Bacteriovoracaceae bacterium]